MLDLMICLLRFGLLVCCLPWSSLADEIDFERQIKPILDRRCAECHMGKHREGGLRFGSRDDALAELDSGDVAIAPGAPDDGSLLARIVSHEMSDRMPPDGERLSAQEVEWIRQWIQQGANWSVRENQKHWSYVAPQRPLLPVISGLSQEQNAIDRWVAMQWEARGLTLSPEEEPARLIRRVSLALTGLPPSPEQIAAYLADSSEDKYEHFVDACLASSRYGERWAQPWLDLARYADSNGFQADQLRASWAYRDWVIQSINRDQPFDQFTVEQLAGDLIPNATLKQKIATGFHRTVTCNVEAGVHPEENRINQIFDRVNTTGAVFLGTTLECCQCHNHKYDPFTQDDYYRLFAFFNNTPLEVRLTSGVSYDFYGPNMELPLDPPLALRRKTLQGKIAELKRAKASQKRVSSNRLNALKSEWIAELKQPATWHALKVLDFQTTSGETDQMLEDDSILVGGSLPGTSSYQVKARTELSRLTAFRLEVLTHSDLPGTGPGRGDVKRPNFILSEFQASLQRRSEAEQSAREVLKLVNAVADFSQSKWEVGKAIDEDQKTGWAIGPQFFQDHWAVFPIDSAVTLSEPANEIHFQLDQNYGRGRTIGRFRLSATADPVATIGFPEDIKKILLLEKPNSAQIRKLDAFLEARDPESVKLNSQLAQLQKELAQTKPDTTLVMQEMEQPRDTFKLMRGNYLAPGKQLTPGVPAVLHPMDESLPKNRLGLARWMVDPANPLIARVAVNRWWANFFGRGLMASAEDFGTQSDRASHPELLDWLAVELMEHGWSRKHIHKQIVMSDTFRQSSKWDATGLEVDPQNRWLARGPRFRMPAEMIRDNALAISGLLSSRMGGPPVMPFQPANIWRTVGRNGPKWKVAEGEDRFRRGVYVVWRRAAPYPSFVNFDAPDRAACVIERPRTNTPLQALTLLNDQAFLEMAGAMAQRAASQDASKSVRQQIQWAMRNCVAREPVDEEVHILWELYQAEFERFQQTPGAAKDLLKDCLVAQQGPQQHENHLAALTMVCNVLLNLDETINY